MSTSLDHIILLLPAQDFDKVPSWLSANFNIIEGGTHSQGTSHNKLVIFKDGSYLELFSWVDPQPKGASPHADFPSWASKPEGYIIDWALSGDDAQANYEGIIERLDRLKQKQKQQADPTSSTQIDMTYDKPSSGGRRRKDGKELQWQTTRPRLLLPTLPKGSDERPRLDVPFFCHDVTDRKLRVPFDDASITSHPCGATGVSSITVAVPEAQFELYSALYSAILGDARDRPSTTAEFHIDLPTGSASGQAGRQCVVKLRSEKHSDSFFEGSGMAVQHLALVTENSDLKGSKLDTLGLGRFVELC